MSKLCVTGLRVTKLCVTKLRVKMLRVKGMCVCVGERVFPLKGSRWKRCV